MTGALLVARQLAALRRHQWSTLDAVGFVADALPTGDLKSTCERARQQLRAGATAASTGDALEQLLARGDGASPEAFDCLAEALDARAHAAVGRAAAVGMARVLVVGPLLVGCLFGWVVVPELERMVPHPPAVTELSIAILGLLALVGVPLAAAAWFVLPRLAARWSPGAHQFALAAELFEASAAQHAGAPPRYLVGADLQFYLWRLARTGPAQAARETAQHVRADGRARLARYDRVAPIAVLAAGAGVFGTLLVPLLLPIFSLAGAIK